MPANLRERHPSGPGWIELQRPKATFRPGVLAASAWRYGRIFVISGLQNMQAPDGSGDVIPQWHISVTRLLARPSDSEVLKARRSFHMEEAEEDNHHPGIARNFMLVVDPKRRVACECKEADLVVREVDGYTWSNSPAPHQCRGCDLARALGTACPIHGSGRIVIDPSRGGSSP